VIIVLYGACDAAHATFLTEPIFKTARYRPGWLQWAFLTYFAIVCCAL